MSGAGSAIVAYTVENELGAGPAATDPAWIQPGIDITVSELTVDQALERSRQPNNPLPAGSREGNFEGGIGLEWTLTDANFHDLVFADGGTALPSNPMQAPSSTWYFATKLPDGTTESRTPTGAIVTDAEVTYEQGNDIRVSLTLLYGNEPDDITTPAESDIQQPSEADAYTWHGASFKVDTLAQPLMQNTTLSLSALARFRRGQSRHPYDAVVDAIEPAFSTDAVFTERDQLAQAVDDVVDDTNSEVDKVSGEFALENGVGDTITYTLSGLQPTTYSWSELVAAESNLSEPIDWHITDVEAAEVTA